MVVARAATTASARAATLLRLAVRHMSSSEPSSGSELAAAAPAGAVAKPQAPNRAATWSKNQQAKHVATTGPRFEQTNWDYQPNPPSAQELIAAVPVKLVKGRRVACDGGGGALGHPKIYINLDQEKPMACGYCGLRFQREHSDDDYDHGH